jgi:hypothetical protein
VPYAKTPAPDPKISCRYDGRRLQTFTDVYRRLRKFSAEARLDEGEALSFLFENFTSVTHEENLKHRLRIFNSELEDRKK